MKTTLIALALVTFARTASADPTVQACTVDAKGNLVGCQVRPLAPTPDHAPKGTVR